MELAIINHCSKLSHNNNKSFLLKPTQYVEHDPSSLCLLHISKDKLLLLMLIFNLVCENSQGAIHNCKFPIYF